MLLVVPISVGYKLFRLTPCFALRQYAPYISVANKSCLRIAP